MGISDHSLALVRELVEEGKPVPAFIVAAVIARLDRREGRASFTSYAYRSAAATEDMVQACSGLPK